jgi:hypothetical protein
MENQKKITDDSVESVLSDHIDFKIYHSPHLFEWGNLQEITRGGVKQQVFDDHGTYLMSDPFG